MTSKKKKKPKNRNPFSIPAKRRKSGAIIKKKKRDKDIQQEE